MRKAIGNREFFLNKPPSWASGAVAQKLRDL
jgi:hypothetical protein